MAGGRDRTRSPPGEKAFLVCRPLGHVTWVTPEKTQAAVSASEPIVAGNDSSNEPGPSQQAPEAAFPQLPASDSIEVPSSKEDVQDTLIDSPETDLSRGTVWQDSQPLWDALDWHLEALRHVD